MSFTNSYLVGRTRRLLRQLLQRMWFRSSLYSLVAVLTALLAAIVGPYVPVPREFSLAADSVGGILDILASSMLVVTTFSLTIMVSAYAGAANTVTPRTTQLLITDSVAMNTLATFLGSFLFSVFGVIGISAGIYDDNGLWILFLATLGVVVMVTTALLRWIRELAYFGRVADTIQRVERVATDTVINWGRKPFLGGEKLESIPGDAEPLYVTQAGYIRFIDMPGLRDLAANHDLKIYLTKLPGQFTYPALPLLRVVGQLDDNVKKAVLACFNIGEERNFDQDPRLGLVVLSEIASRALSPAMNDPGTAIQIMGSATRVLLAYVEACREAEEASFQGVFVPEILATEFLDDFFRPIIRDGAAVIEVQIRIQLALQALAFADPVQFAGPAREMGNLALERSLMESYVPSDQQRLKDVSDWSMPKGYQHRGKD